MTHGKTLCLGVGDKSKLKVENGVSMISLSHLQVHYKVKVTACVL